MFIFFESQNHNVQLPREIFPEDSLLGRYSKFYPIKIIQKKLSTNKWRKKYYPEVLSKNFFIQNVRDLFYVTLYH